LYYRDILIETFTMAELIQPPAKPAVDFNYSFKYLADGSLLYTPNFLLTGPVNKELAM
jgi:hypothetical protein